jgi:uncharacterized coiled-coil protein SlyX
MDSNAMAEKAYLKEQETRATVSGPVANQIDRQRDILERLDHQVSRLIERLEPILGDNYPRPGAVAEDSPNMSPLATTLYLLNEKFDEISNAVSSTLDRIEL